MEKSKKQITNITTRRINAIIGYLKAYSGKYNLDALKKKIIDSGYTKEELDIALGEIGIENSAPAKSRIINSKQENEEKSKASGTQEPKSSEAKKIVSNEIETIAEKVMQEKAGQKKNSNRQTPGTRIKKNKKKIIIGIIFSLIASIILFAVYKKILISFIGFFGFFVLFFLYLYFKRVLADSAKISKIESIFPDFLQLMASNLRAGMTIDRAILMSARPEFSPLDTEIMMVGKDIATGKTLENSLLDMTKRIKSEKVEKTIFLIISGIRAGGNLSILLEETSRNTRKRGFVEKRASSNVLMYVIFVFVAASIGAPLLFSLSTLMVETLMNTISSMQGMDTSSMSSTSMPFSFSSVNVSLEFITYFAIVFILTTDILASLVLGLVGKGEEREGVKYILPMVAISLFIFFVLRYILSGFVVNLVG